MKALEEKILAEGEVYPGEILKVSGFLNHRIDVDFLMQMGKEIARLYQDTPIDKIITIEASGIAIAVCAAAYMHVPVVFAKKNRTINILSDVYCSSVRSYTHGEVYNVVISKEHLSAKEKCLIIDDFLAKGNALNGLMDIISQAGAVTAGVAVAIEKGFQHGGDHFRSQGVRVESLAIVESMTDDSITFRKQAD